MRFISFCGQKVWLTRNSLPGAAVKSAISLKFYLSILIKIVIKWNALHPWNRIAEVFAWIKKSTENGGSSFFDHHLGSVDNSVAKNENVNIKNDEN
jgi:hypothetical protein